MAIAALESVIGLIGIVVNPPLEEFCVDLLSLSGAVTPVSQQARQHALVPNALLVDLHLVFQAHVFSNGCLRVSGRR